jgi:hypothetical protein
LASSGENERKGEGSGVRRDSRRCRAGEAEGEAERKGMGMRLASGAGSSGRGVPRGGASGPLGRRAGRGRKVSFFFFFSFSNSFQINF